jgi:hypothetical protein
MSNPGAEVARRVFLDREVRHLRPLPVLQTLSSIAGELTVLQLSDEMSGVPKIWRRWGQMVGKLIDSIRANEPTWKRQEGRKTGRNNSDLRRGSASGGARCVAHLAMR